MSFEHMNPRSLDIKEKNIGIFVYTLYLASASSWLELDFAESPSVMG